MLEDAEGPLLAAAGSLEMTAVRVFDGERQQVNRRGRAWELEAGQIEFDLSDQKYSELTEIDEDAAEVRQ